MLHYLINTSICWLAALLLYEVWLRKESFHQYNRIYLLTSIAAGLIIPLIKINTASITTTPVLQPIKKVYELKNEIVNNQPNEMANTISSASFSFSEILLLIYFIGVVISLLFIVWEILRLMHLYKHGTQFTEQGCIIIETGKSHPPFSFFSLIFVSSRAAYNTNQWQLVMTHEKSHYQHLHAVDNILLILLRIIFWFHPLPYIYFRKLRMIHEFQADERSANDTKEYGTFLLEQNMLQGAPLIAHSINYSSLKNRIMMLTKNKSSRKHLIKYLSALPLMLILIVCCTQASYSGQTKEKGKSITFKGNKIGMSAIKVIPYSYLPTYKQQVKMFGHVELGDSVPIKHWRTEVMVMEPVLSEIIPTSINEKAIYGNEEKYAQSEDIKIYTPPIFAGAEKSLDDYLFSQLKKDLDQLDNGSYIFEINRMVIDDKGNIGYFEAEGVTISMSPDEKQPINSDALLQSIRMNMQSALEKEVNFKPAIKNGKAINARLNLDGYQINVKDHKARLVIRAGC